MNATRAIAAGAIATASMTALLLIEPAVGLPEIAIGQLLSSSLSFTTAVLSVGPALGWLLHFLVGIAWALLYAGVVLVRLPGTPLIRGILYGGLVFLLAQTVLMPLVGAGLFSRGDVPTLVGSLLGHLVYGGVLGWIYGAASPIGLAAASKAS
jgi:uncharacterized membrane protein YagU involved in acid resistance